MNGGVDDYWQQITNARRSQGLTQAELANKIGVSPEAISKWESGKYAPSPENKRKLYRILGMAYATVDKREVRLFHERNMSAFLKGKFNSGDFPESIKALSFAKVKHNEQYRKPKELEIPYINHPLTMACHALAMGLEKDTLIAALILHDVCEDCNVLPEELPVCKEVQDVVALVTKPKHDFSERKYYEAIMDNPIACLVKCIDRCNNLSTMAIAFSAEGVQDYVEETGKYYPELLRIIKEQPEYNNASWLLSYQIRSLLQLAKRINA